MKCPYEHTAGARSIVDHQKDCLSPVPSCHRLRVLTRQFSCHFFQLFGRVGRVFVLFVGLLYTVVTFWFSFRFISASRNANSSGCMTMTPLCTGFHSKRIIKLNKDPKVPVLCHLSDVKF